MTIIYVGNHLYFNCFVVNSYHFFLYIKTVCFLVTCSFFKYLLCLAYLCLNLLDTVNCAMKEIGIKALLPISLAEINPTYEMMSKYLPHKTNFISKFNFYSCLVLSLFCISFVILLIEVFHIDIYYILDNGFNGTILTMISGFFSSGNF